jgi:single-strand DNA-binding protein
MLNTVILMGRLTANPETRQNSTGSISCNLTIALDRPVAQGAERQTDFIRCTAWNKTAEFMTKYFEKGSLVIVEGSLRSGSYTDRKYPDVTHYTTDVSATRVSFGETKAAHELSKQNSANRAAGGYGGNGYGGNGNYGGSNSNYGNYGGNGGNAGNTGNQGGYNPPAGNPFDNPSQMGGLSDFEEVISDADLPF